MRTSVFKSRYRILILPTLLFTLAWTTVRAQQVTGGLTFSLRDSLGEPIASANAAVTGSELQGVRVSVCDERGTCTILALPPGAVSIRISHPAYQPIIIENVRILLGKTTDLGEYTLHLSVHDMPEIVVSADNVSIDATSTTYGSNLSPPEFDALPLDRNYRDIITLLPQSNTSYYGDGVNIGGATGMENKYIVDGVEVTDPLLESNGTILPYNFIREVEVKGGGYASDIRGTLGGIVNVVTYSGTNEFHGSAFGFYTSNRFSSHRLVGLSDPTQGGFSNYDVGFGLGGPIIRDQLWFFAAYNPTFARRDVDVPGYGIYVDKTRVNSFAAKLTWSASDRLHLAFTATGDPTDQDAVGNGIGFPPTSLANPDPYFMTIGYGGINLSLNGSYTPGGNLLIEGSLARVNHHATGEPATSAGRDREQYVDWMTNEWSGGPPGSWNSFRYANIARLAISATYRGHTLRIGAEYKRNGTDNRYENDIIYRYDSTYYEEYTSKGYETVHENLPSIFAEDTWQVTRSLSVHAGIRWDGQYIIGSNGETAQRVTVLLEPRLGFAYILDDEATHKIFGSFGRFAQELSLFQPMNLFSDQGYSYGTSYDHDPRISRSGGVTLWGGPFTIAPPIDRLRGQFFDEVSLGYERALPGKIRLRLEGLYRTLREAIDFGYVASTGTSVFGNPGKGLLSEWPAAERNYTALTVSVERGEDRHFNFLASYVLSRNYGNYPGIFSAAFHTAFPNSTYTFGDMNSMKAFGRGLLPNDRTHVLKLSGSYRFDFGISAGMVFIAESGTPLSEYVDYSANYIPKLVAPRGGRGRTPALWDLSARIAYVLPLAGSAQARVILDVFHIASQRTVVDVQQDRGHLDANGQFDVFYSSYGQAYRFQPPMSARLGMEVSF